MRMVWPCVPGITAPCRCTSATGSWPPLARRFTCTTRAKRWTGWWLPYRRSTTSSPKASTRETYGRPVPRTDHRSLQEPPHEGDPRPARHLVRGRQPVVRRPPAYRRALGGGRPCYGGRLLRPGLRHLDGFGGSLDRIDYRQITRGNARDRQGRHPGDARDRALAGAPEVCAALAQGAQSRSVRLG